MSTTAVSFRKGNLEENKEFAGVEGEIVADLGVSSTSPNSTNTEATIVLHTGNGEAGGIRMAREDLLNVKTITPLANLGLARTDLSNIEHCPSESIDTVESILKSDYKIASQDAHDINTTQISAAGTTAPGGGPMLLNTTMSNLYSVSTNAHNKLVDALDDQLALKNMSNVDTTELATGEGTSGKHSGKDLAYKDMSNIDTQDLAERGEDSAGYHSGKDLAYRDISNVTFSSVKTLVDTAYNTGISSNKFVGYEDTINKIDGTNTIINPSNSKSTTLYPSVNALTNYVAKQLNGYASADLDNITSWDIATRKEISYKYNVSYYGNTTSYNVGDIITLTGIPNPDYATKQSRADLTSIITNTNYFFETDVDKINYFATHSGELTTNLLCAVGGDPADEDFTKVVWIVEKYTGTKWVINNSSEDVKVQIVNKDSDGVLTLKVVTPLYGYFKNPLPDSYTWSDGTLTFDLTSSLLNNGGLMLASFENSEIVAENNKTAGMVHYNKDTHVVGDKEEVTKVKSVYGALYTEQTIGKFEVENQTINNAEKALAKLTTSTYTGDMGNPTITSVCGIEVTDNNVYLKKSGTSDFINTNYELLNKSEISASYQSKVTSATTNNIATWGSNGNTKDSGKKFKTTVETTESDNNILTGLAVKTYVDDQVNAAIAQAVVFKGIVADQTQLPASGNINGDMYWITAFVSPAPTGMTVGRSGAAIYKGSPDNKFEYTEDVVYNPDESTITLNSNGKLSVKISNKSGNQLTKDNNNGLYVAPELPSMSGNADKFLKTDGTNASWVTITSNVPTLPTPTLTAENPTATFHLLVELDANNEYVYSWVEDTQITTTVTVQN